MQEEVPKAKILQSKNQRLICLIGFILIAAMLSMSFAFAAGGTGGAAATGNIENGIKTGSQQLYNIMTAVILPVGAVFFAWNAFRALFGGERGMEQAKKNMLTVVVVLALVYLAPLVVTQIGGWFTPSSSWTF